MAALLLEQLEAASLIKKLKGGDTRRRPMPNSYNSIDHNRCNAFQWLLTWPYAGAFEEAWLSTFRAAPLMMIYLCLEAQMTAERPS